MVQLTTPVTILKSQTEALLGHLPRVFDGDVDGVHDARVATRRVREVLPLTHEWHRTDIDDLSARFKRVGRALGRVRDADVRIALLSYLEAHVSFAAPSLVVIRHERERKRLKAVRKLIKQFEHLDVEHMLHDVGRRCCRQFQPWTTVLGSWRRQLGRTIAQRATAARDAIDHTTGVYFPNRSHSARIALKKFRYAAEIGELTGMGTLEASIRALKKGQEILGDLHDRQALVDKLPSLATPEHPDIASDHIRAVIQALEAECRELHGKYVSRRSSLLDVCRQAEEGFAPARAAAARVASLTAGVVAVSTAAYAWRRLSQASESRSGEVAIRIPIDHDTRLVG